MDRLGRHFLIFLLIGVACYMGLALLGQKGEVWNVLIEFPLAILPLLLLLAFLNYLLRYVRWHVYLNALGIRLGYWRSFQIFMAGLTMTITPGKAGEALKAHLLQKEGNNPWSLGLPIVFVERLTDLMGVLILVTLGMIVLPIERGIVLLGMAMCLFFLLIFAQPTLFKVVIRGLGRLPGMAAKSQWLLEMHRNVRRLLKLKFMFIGVLISTIAWFSECLVLYFAVITFQRDASWFEATFIYALSTLAGALSMLPGGLVATEGSMTGLLLLFGFEGNQAVSVTLIVRICTLWFAVFLGMIFLFFLQRRSRLNRGLASAENVL